MIPPSIEEDLVDDDDNDEVFSSIYSCRTRLSSTRQPNTSLPQLTSFYSCTSNSVNSLAAPKSERVSVCSQKSSGVYEDVDSWLTPAALTSGKQKRDSGVLSITESDEGACNTAEEYVFMGQASPVSVPNRYHDDSPMSNASASPAYNGNTSQLVSYKSMELLTSDAIEDISSFTLQDPSPSHSFKKDDDETPTIPPRASSLVKSNQLITDKELIKQGQRLSQILNITPVLPKRKISLALVKNTVSKLLKHHTSAGSLKPTPLRKLSNEKKHKKLKSSVSTTSLPTSQIHQLDYAPNQSYDHLSSWIGSSCDLNRPAHHPQLRLSSSHNPSSQYTSSSDSNLRRFAVSVDNVCDLDGYSPRSSVVMSDDYVSPQSTSAWLASDEEDQYDSYVPMADQFELEDGQLYENVGLENGDERDYENLDPQEDNYVKYDPQLEDDDYEDLDEDEIEYENMNPTSQEYENFNPHKRKPGEHQNIKEYENFNPQGRDAWRALQLLVSDGCDHHRLEVNSSVATDEGVPLDGYVEMKTWIPAEQKNVVGGQHLMECIMPKCKEVEEAFSENNNIDPIKSRQDKELDPDYENVPLDKDKRVKRNFSAKYHFHPPPPPSQFLPKLSCHIEEDEEENKPEVGEEATISVYHWLVVKN